MPPSLPGRCQVGKGRAGPVPGSPDQGTAVPPPRATGRQWGTIDDSTLTDEEIRTLHTPERPDDLGVEQRDHGRDDDRRQGGLGDVVEERGQVVQRQQHQDPCGGGAPGTSGPCHPPSDSHPASEESAWGAWPCTGGHSRVPEPTAPRSPLLCPSSWHQGTRGAQCVGGVLTRQQAPRWGAHPRLGIHGRPGKQHRDRSVVERAGEAWSIPLCWPSRAGASQGTRGDIGSHPHQHVAQEHKGASGSYQQRGTSQAFTINLKPPISTSERPGRRSKHPTGLLNHLRHGRTVFPTPHPKSLC